MLKKIAGALKNKKTILLFVLLFFLFFTPHFASAGWAPWNWGDAIGNALMNAVITIAFGIPLLFTMVFAQLAGIILGAVITLTTSGVSFTHSTAVDIGWVIVRNLANMIIVLGFVVVGVATAIRYKEYEATKLLPKLIMAALLINFSRLLCGIVIDGSNILTNFFFTKTTGGSIFYKILADAGRLFKNMDGDWKTFGPLLVGMIIFNFFAGFIYLLYAVLLLCRVIAIWLLVILSPLAFVCSVFPLTKSVWDMWKKNFIQWTIISIPMAFFYYLAAMMITGSANLLAIKAGTGDSILTSDFFKVMTNSFSLIVPGLFLVIGFFVSLQIAPMGASAVMGAANKYKGAAMKGTLGAMAKGSGKIGQALQNYGNAPGRNGAVGLAARTIGAGANFASRSPQRIDAAKKWLTQKGEQTGFVAAGTQAQQRQKEISENAGRVSALANSGREEDIQVLVKIAREGKGAERAAAVEALSSQNRLGLITNESERRDAIAHAINTGSNFKNLAKGMSSDDIADISNNGKFNSSVRTEGFKTLMERGDLDKITAGNRQTRIDEAVQNGVKMSDIKKSDYRMAEHDTGRITALTAQMPAGTPIADIRARARQEQLEANWSSMSGNQKRGMDTADMTGEFFTSQVMNAGGVAAFNTADNPHIAALLEDTAPGVPGVRGAGARMKNDIRLALQTAITKAQAEGNDREVNRLKSIRSELRRIIRTP